MRHVAVLLLALAATFAQADSYLPPGALSYHEERLPNGLRIVSQQVHGAPYISARLLIHVGTDSFACRDRELPHLVEHLLFSANATWQENEIDDQASDWGGQINAYTYAEDTEVVLDAHARFQTDAVQLLATLIGDFAPDADAVTHEKSVVEHESGTRQTPLRLWWSQQPVSQIAGARFAEAAGLHCSAGIAPVAQLQLTDVQDTFRRWYVPSNMILVLVGDLSPDGLQAARDAFAALPPRATPVIVPPKIVMPTGDDFVSGWLSGVAQQDVPTAFGITPFRDWEGYYVLQLAESWLNDRLYNDLRSQRGITYTPEAAVDYEGTALVISLRAQTDAGDTAFVEHYLRDLTAGIARDGIPQEDFDRLRNSALLGMAQSFERISDRADYIAGSWRELESGSLFNSETFYRQLDYLHFRALLARDWPERFVVLDDSPRLSWNAWAIALAGAVALLAVGVTLFVWRRLRRVQGMG